MNQADEIIALLNRLLEVEYRSFAVYVLDASPWVARGREQAAEVVRNIALDQQGMAERVAEEILARDGRVDTGDFPMEFTDTHDLGLDYLVGQIIEGQHRDIAIIEQIVARLAADPAAQDLAYEVLGSERAHLEALEEVARSASQGGTSDVAAPAATAGV